ncbi:MAG: hypothetical protein WBP89_15615 [Sedimenticolaceae bacterium]
MMRIERVTFFRPDEIAREDVHIPAALFNRCRLLLSRCDYAHVFVPVRTMQLQAVIDAQEIIFVDNQAYAVRDGEGGRLIMLTWRFRRDRQRDDLNRPAPIELVYYHSSARELHDRLIGDFAKALYRVEQRHKESGCEPRTKHVLPFQSG